MNRPILIGLLGSVIVAAAIALSFVIDREPSGERPGTATATLPPGAPGTGMQAPAISDAPVKAPSGAAPADVARREPAPAPTDPSRAAKAPVAPSFDVVRVNPRGDAVIAGRAAPNAVVSVLDGKTQVGQVKADARGEWVLVPDKPLTPGSHELSLSAQLGTDGPVVAAHNVVLVVPERGKDIAGRPAEVPSGALALAVPREGRQPSTVLQLPQSDATPGEAAAGAPPRLSLDALDYDHGGDVAMSGRAAPGAELQVYLNDRPLGTTEADERGAWRLAPPGAVAEGIYRLRVDRLNKGKVVERIEMPFARQVAAADVPPEGQVLVQPGNSLWRIARQSYGEGVRFTLIFEANRTLIRDPDLIYPGQIFVLPRVN
jgi:nucleoid-associated protein YgaU